MPTSLKAYRDAKASGALTYISSPCSKGHSGVRYVSSQNCVECGAAHAKARVARLTPEQKQSNLTKRREHQRALAAAKREVNAGKVAEELRRNIELQKELGFSLPTTRAAAKAAGERWYFSGKECALGHLTRRSVIGGCEECGRHYGRETSRKQRQENPEHVKKLKREDWNRNRETYANKKKEFWAANRDRLRKLAMERHYANPLIARVNGANRRARQSNATPPWLTSDQKKEIRQLHKQAATMFDSEGRVAHVDHIIPLRGKEVCGLHVPWNMRIVTIEENSTKGNRVRDQFLGTAVPIPLGSGAMLSSYQLH